MNPAYRRAALGAVLALSMLGVVPGVAFAAGPSCGDTLMANTTLHANLSCTGLGSGQSALILGKQGITLNLNGYTITGPVGDDDAYGVYSEKNNVTVRNGKIESFGYSVYYYGVTGGAVKGLTITGDSEAYEEGIYIYYGSNDVVNNNKITDVGYAVDVEYAADVWVTNNKAFNSYESFYSYYNTNTHFINNKAKGYSDTGFYAEYSGNETYQDNLANAMSQGGSTGFYLYCYYYGIVTAIDNEAIDNSSYGIEVYECYDYYDYTSTDVTTVSGNYSHDNSGYGFYGYYSYPTVWTNNVAKNNDSYGFYLDYMGNMRFNNNVANGNGSTGIYVDDNYGSYGNTKSFKNNVANNNGDWGMYGSYGISSASGNLASGNSTAPDDCFNVNCK